MKTSSVLFSLSLLSTALGAGALLQGEGNDGQAPSLVKVPPREVVPDRVDSVEFDAAAWTARLAESDLAERERSFETIVMRARRDSAARAFLGRLSEGQDELAWTARLALREVRQSRGFAFLPHLSMDEFGQLDPFADGLDAMLERSKQNFHLILPPEMEAFGIPKRAFQGGASESRSVRVRKDADGWRIQVTEGGPDGDTTRTFEGETLKEILEQNPELEGELGIQGEGPEEGGSWDGFRIDLGRPGMLFRPDEERILGFFELAPVLETASPLSTDKLGVRVAPPTPAQIEEFALEGGVGLWVESVYPATIAENLGVEAGSVLLDLEGKAMTTADDITAALTGRKDRGSVHLTWLDPSGRRRHAVWKEKVEVRESPAPKPKVPQNGD